eukprot:TCALIF_06136-PA protein Name:"Similar to LYSA1 Diaminopimelate decarboxylase 1, chloroplastic (Arabidopsis thaliana)" AED:0.17 eAED:0.17 QI:0/0.4/0/0.83/1/1/6/0/354
MRGLSLLELPTTVPKSDANHEGTPIYVYSKRQILDNIKAYQEAFGDRKNVKLALEIGFPGNRIYFNGNGKRPWEMALALENGCIMNVDSVFNAKQLVKIVQEKDTSVEVLLRLNIEIETNVHPYLKTASQKSKFGIVDGDFQETLKVLLPEAQIKLLEKVIEENAPALTNINLVNVGGGLGIKYYHEESKDVPTVNDLANALPHNSPFAIMVEPGRSLVGNTGVLLVQTIGVKTTTMKNFIVVDGSMTELIRPALYDAFHNILPVVKKKGGQTHLVDFVGPVCESGDFLGKDRQVRLPSEGDYFAVMDSGAYCMAMASNYNLRARPAEILVNGEKFHLIQHRETYDQVVRRLGY